MELGFVIVTTILQLLFSFYTDIYSLFFSSLFFSFLPLFLPPPPLSPYSVITGVITNFYLSRTLLLSTNRVRVRACFFIVYLCFRCNNPFFFSC